MENRIIKFRGKRIDNGKKVTDINKGEFVYGSLVVNKGEAYIVHIVEKDNIEMIEVDPKTVGQLTGLHDKNGKEIYEGDILKNTKHDNQLVEVFWKGCSIENDCWIKWGGWEFRKLKGDERMTYAIYDQDIEIIGNIYENEDLICNQ